MPQIRARVPRNGTATLLLNINLLGQPCFTSRLARWLTGMFIAYSFHTFKDTLLFVYKGDYVS